jgi:phosphoribosylaminoimidazole-succinocarboxamide synthase
MSTPNLIHQGKVRDVYDIGDNRLLMVASDRISAFDVVLPQPVPDKGRVLTAMTRFWTDELSSIAPTHLIATDPAEVEAAGPGLDDLAGRAMVVHKADMLPIECIVRGYIVGSAWKEYRQSGTMHGQQLPEGMQEADQLPEPVFTPSTKAESGHDENIDFDTACNLVGREVAEEARRLSLELFSAGAELARQRGIIIADTKFELGWVDGKLTVCDEILTPDSSRFWAVEDWKPGATPPSFDKQPVRDWLESTGWDKSPPPPDLPDDVVGSTAARYAEAYERITGQKFADWPGVRS